MAFQNAYSAYQKNNVTTASQGRLVVLLYEGAVKNLSGAIKLFEADGSVKPQNIEQFGKFIQKAQAIITELQVSLDMDKGGDIAKHLMALYIYFNQQLIDGSIKKDKAKLEEVHKMLNDLLESWRTVANSTANAPAAQVRGALNIQG